MAEWRGGSQCRHGPAWADPAPPTPSPPTPRLPAFQMPPFPHPPLSPSPQLGTDLQEGGREAGQRASVPSILPALSAANLGPSSAFITPPPACPPAYPPNPKRVLDQVPNRAASSGIPVTMHCCVSATAAWHSWGRVRAWGVEQQRERGMRTQRRKRAIAKTPRKKDGERWQSCLAPGQFPAEDGQLLLPGLPPGFISGFWKSGSQKKLEVEEGIQAQAGQWSRTWKGLERKEDSCRGGNRPMSQRKQQNPDSDIPDLRNHLQDQR
uniref:uncharacterized protein LOC118550100 isoform X2 n=1 Tax=Halichoerus grypus TaxID=9711 RepID=UPI001658E1E0|nr:uncharacterized protein LOC118550100 isoform X2 [Halichoerus grypus]